MGSWIFIRVTDKKTMVLSSLAEGGKPCTTEFYVSLLEKQNKIGEFVGIGHSNFDVEIIQREKIRFGVFGSAKGADVFQMRRRALLVGIGQQP